MIRRLEALPAAADAEDGSLYLEINSNGRILRRLLKDYRLSAFFDITVADLGDGHLGYAGAGYDGLGSNYAVNAGGSSQYAGIGAISEQYRSFVGSTFTRVGAFTITPNTRGFGAYNGNLYRVEDTGTETRVVGFNPDTGAVISTSGNASPSEQFANGFTVMNGVGYVYGAQRNRFYSYDIDSTTWTQLTTNVDVSEVQGLAHDGSNVHVIYRNASNQYFIAPLNTSNGSLGTGQRLTGFESDDTEVRTQGFTGIDDTLYISTEDFGISNPHIYEVNPSNGSLTVIGDITPATSRLQDLAHLGNYIYARNIENRGLYRAEAAQGNRWVATFPLATTEVAADETALKLFTQRGGTEIELTKDDRITDALVFASDYDSATVHTISVGDTPEWALYNSSDEQLYEGAAEAIYSELAAA